MRTQTAGAAAHFEPKIGARVYSVMPGEHLVIAEPDSAVGTLLGSCVSACIRDRRSGLGGLNHFLLPGRERNQSARYGAFAMEVLINQILSSGARREDLEAKVFGGAAVIASLTGRGIGDMNAAFVRDYLRNEGIPIRAADLGGQRGRRLYFFPATGEVKVQYMDSQESRRAALGEARLEERLRSKPQTGSVELF